MAKKRKRKENKKSKKVALIILCVILVLCIGVFAVGFNYYKGLKAAPPPVEDTLTYDFDDETQPEVVCIELDANRARSMTQKPSDPDIKEIIKQKKVGSFITNLVLSSYQKKMAQELDSEVGGEMKQAIASASELGVPVRYIDRDVQITFKRIWGNLGFFKKARAIVSNCF